MSRGMRHGASGTAALVLAGSVAVLVLAPTAGCAQTMDDHIYTYVAFDELEYVPGLDARPVAYDGQAWIGGDFDRLWLKARGEQSTRAGAGDLQAEALYSRTASAYWNAQTGLRVDHHYGEGDGSTRALAALGFQGLAPYWFEVEAFVYVSQDADLSARLEAGYELLFTQRLVLEPEVELDLAVQDVPEFGVASGLDGLELGARLRYEIVRELAPYIGVSWERQKLPQGPVETATHGSLVAGVRWWY